jgi:hypothetical protein
MHIDKQKMYIFNGFQFLEHHNLKNISRKFLGVSLIWTFFSHVGAIFFLNSPYQS